jgi:hypothetical protein
MSPIDPVTNPKPIYSHAVTYHIKCDLECDFAAPDCMTFEPLTYN